MKWEQILKPYLPMPLMPAEPRLRHCNLNFSIGSMPPLLLSIFLHFCFISLSDLAVAAMLLSVKRNKNGALGKVTKISILLLPWQRPRGAQAVHWNWTAGSKFSFFLFFFFQFYVLVLCILFKIKLNLAFNGMIMQVSAITFISLIW